MLRSSASWGPIPGGYERAPQAPPSRSSRSCHPTKLPLRNNPLEEARNYFKLKTILGNPQVWGSRCEGSHKGSVRQKRFAAQ
jgi:hypothetical protein